MGKVRKKLNLTKNLEYSLESDFEKEKEAIEAFKKLIRDLAKE